ncbi:serotriflin-like [Pyxicephalus adspersus]|uniref:serotriflin-like n=1 Tax=Pyxicephalus adspersus TaxID=30357 RepID=UPI003B5B8AC6
MALQVGITNITWRTGFYTNLQEKNQLPLSIIRNKMLPLIFMCFVKLLEHTVVLGHPQTIVFEHGIQNKSKGVISYAQDVVDAVAFLPPNEEEFFNTKHNKVVKKRSAGRPVDLPADVVKAMMDKPISYFSPSTGMNKKIILDAHNKYRCKADPPAKNMLKVIWNDEAAKSAEAWAKKCIQGHSPVSERTITDFKCGENIFLAPYKVTWDVVVDCWHSEIVDFDYGIGPKNDAVTGHVTQLMWGTSYLVGCAMAECPNLVNKYNYVCHQCPPGNRKPLAFPYKKGKPCEDCPNSCENNLCTNPCPRMDWYNNCETFKSGPTCGTDQSLISDCPAMCTCTKGEIK